MVTNNIDWGLDNNKGVSFFTINKGLNKLIIQEAQLLITFEQAINKLNNSISIASNKLMDLAKNLLWLNNIDELTTRSTMLLSFTGMGLLSGLSSLAVEPEITEESSLVTKGADYLSKGAQNFALPKMQFLIQGMKGVTQVGMIVSLLQAFCSSAKGIDNSKTMKLQAFTDAYKQDLKLFEGSEDKGFKTMQAIAKAEQKGIEEEYRSKSRELYYNK